MSKTERIFLWTAPRCMSTAFTISISTLPGVKTFYEPYAVPYFRSNELPTVSCATTFTSIDYTFEEASNMIQAEYKDASAVFIKDFPHHFQGKYDMFLHDNFKEFTHSFLIRNAQRVVLSNFNVSKKYFREACSRGDIGLEQLRDFYFFLKKNLGIEPIIIDADDLLANPEEMMKLYCDNVGLTYREGMTKWEPGCGWGKGFLEQTLFSNHDVWIGEAISSTGFKAPTPLPSLPPNLPMEVKKCIDECFKPYSELYTLRSTL